MRLALSAVLLLAGCGEETASPPPRFVGPADWVVRAEAVRPDLEAVLGAPLGETVEFVETSSDEAVEAEAREIRRILGNIEGERRGEELEEYSREAAKGGHTFALGLLDIEGTVRLNRGMLEFEPDQFPDPLNQIFAEILKNKYGEAGPAFADLVIVHELAHVHQHRRFGLREFLRGVRTHSELLARRAVVEGHATWVRNRVAERRGLEEVRALLDRAALVTGEDLDEFPYGSFHDCFEEAEIHLFRYRQGSRFVEEVVARLGYETAVKLMFESPPSLLQVSKPDTWPGPGPESLGTDAAVQRIRAHLAETWESAECQPLPLQIFDTLTSRGPEDLRIAAGAAFREGHRFEGRTFSVGSVRGHLFAAGMSVGAEALAAVWVARNEALDTVVPFNPLLRVRKARYSEAPFEGGLAWLARREYRDYQRVVHEQQLLVRSGPYLLEVRCCNPPDEESGALRVARRLLALLPPGRAADPASADWADRWRAARDPDTPMPVLLELLGEGDRDVRLAALLALGRREALSETALKRVEKDPDWEIRYQARRLSAKLLDLSEEDRIENLRSALADPHPALPAAECSAVRRDCLVEPVPADLLEKLLSHPAARVRREAVRFLEQNVEREISPENLAAITGIAMKDPDPDVRCQAARSLYYHDECWDPALRAAAFRKALSDEDSRVRYEALFALNCGELAIPECRPELEALLTDISETIREDAQEALERIRK